MFMLDFLNFFQLDFMSWLFGAFGFFGLFLCVRLLVLKKGI